MANFVEVKNLFKRFALKGDRPPLPSFYEVVMAIIGLGDGSSRETNHFTALRNINFKLPVGANLGVVGLNGAGKSTLLKILLGRLPPDEGQYIINGSIGGLIELGAGFHSDQSGLANIRINARLLGYSEKEIEAKIPDIIEFSDIGEFIDMPVKTYSSGMSVRLGFSIAIHFVKDVIICDEILAVGDFEFRQKCYKKIHQLKKEKSFILVSHSVRDIALFCDRAILLHHGEVISKGTPEDVIADYSYAEHGLSAEELRKKLANANSEKNFKTHSKLSGNNLLDRAEFGEDLEVREGKFGKEFKDKNAIESLSVTCNHELVRGELNITNRDSLQIDITFNLTADVQSLRIGLPFFDETGNMIIGPDSREIKPTSPNLVSQNVKTISFVFDKFPLNVGRFMMVLAMNNDPGYLHREHICWINVKNITGEFGISKIQFGVKQS